MKFEKLFETDEYPFGSEPISGLFIGAYISRPRECYRCGCDTIFIDATFNEYLCSSECREDVQLNGRVYGEIGLYCPHHLNGIERAKKRLTKV